MAIAYGAAGTALNQTTAATTFNVPYPASVAANDLLVLHIVTNGGIVTAPSGWTLVYNETAVINPRGGLFIKKAVGGETGTLAVTVVSTTGVAQMHRYTGVDTTTPQDAAATSKKLDGTTDVTIILPAITTVSANAWYVYAVAENSTSVTNTGPNTERADFAPALPKAGALYDGIQVAAGSTGTKTVTPSAARAYWGAMMALRPSLAIAGVTYTPAGIASGETFGTAAEINSTVATPTGIASGEAVGTPSEFQYRTYDFNDGTSQGWTASTLGAGTTAVSTAAAHDGKYGVSANVPAATGDQAGYSRTIQDNAARARISGWWKVTTEGASTTSNVPFARMFKGTQRLADVYRQNGQAPGAANVWLRIVKAIGGSNYYFLGTGFSLPLDTWVYVDFTWGLDGKPEVAINGTTYLSAINAPADWFAATDIDKMWLGSQEVGNQGAWAIDSVEVQTLGQAATGEGKPLPIRTAETFGTPAAVMPVTVTPTGITSLEAFGAIVSVGALLISPIGIASAEAFGTTLAAPTITAAPTAIGTAESFGTPSANVARIASPTGIATGEAFGVAFATVGTAYTTGNIGTAEAFGTPTNLGSLRASPPAGIATAEAFGSATWAAGMLTASPGGIASAEAFGSPTMPIPGTTGSPTGIGTAEALGVPAANVQTVATPAGIVSAGIVSNINAVLTYTASPGGIASGETFGTTGQIGLTTAAPTGIASAETFGTPTSFAGSAANPVGIASAESVSNIVAVLTYTASPTGIASASAFGNTTQSNVLRVQPPTLDTGAAVGTPTASGSLTASPAGILTGYGPGFPSVTYATILAPAGIPTGAAFGTTRATITVTSGRYLDLDFEDLGDRFEVADLAVLPGLDWQTGISTTRVPAAWSLADLVSNWTTARLEGEPMTREILKSTGATEQVGGTITEKNGKDLTSTTVEISLGSELRPGTWTTPSVNILGPVNVRKVTMLVGATPNTPKGEYWVWVKITDTPEIITRRFPQKIQVK